LTTTSPSNTWPRGPRSIARTPGRSPCGHQAQNTAVALATLDVLAEHGFQVGRDDVARGFADLRWPARVEILGEGPWLVVDGAHNIASAEALAATLRACFPATRRTLVFATSRDKDLHGQLRALLPLFDTIIATRYLENPRAVPPEEIAAAVVEIDSRTSQCAADPAEALALARRSTKASGLICVTGSLFLAAETRALILGHAPSTAGRVLT
jgi:dihydrofolate synthase/folylpolyglutamate synthase